jgi:hypothetical protein
MKALQNPKILGSLLVGSVGAQQANEIQNQLSLGNISLDDVYDTLINFASSPAVSIINEIQSTPAGEVYAPKESDIEAERKFNEELNKPADVIPDQKKITVDDVGFTETATKPQPLITPDIPEQKTKVEDIGFTESPSMPTILTVDFDEGDKTLDVFPVPQKLAGMFDRKENFYRATDSEGNVSDITGLEFEKAQIRISDTYDKGSLQVANQTLDDESYLDSAPKGATLVKVNLNKKYPLYKEGNMLKNWEWVKEPEGYQFDETKVFNEKINKDVLKNTPTIISNVYKGTHHYSLGTDFNLPVDMAYYPNEKSEPRLKPTTKAKHMILGNQVGEIKMGNKVHPVYDNITFANETKFFVDGGAVDVKQFDLARVINKHLTPDLLGKDYKKDAPCKAGDTTGHCFITTQAAWFELGGKNSGYVPRMLTNKEFPEALKPGETHHYLINPNSKEVIDLTYNQFEKKNINQYDIPYHLGKKSGYQNQAIENNKPTERTQKLLDRVNAENNNPQDAAEIVTTNSGVEINFGNRRARDLELGDDIENYLNYSNYNAESDKTQSEIFGDPKAIEGHGDDPRFLFGFKNKDGSRGYAYGYLTDKNIAFVDQLTATEGSFSPQEYKEIKDAVQNYTGADKVGGFRVSGARSGVYDKQATVSPDSPGQVFSGPDFISQNTKIKGTGKNDKILVNDILTFLDSGKTRDLYNPNDFKSAVNEAVSEIEYQLAQDITGKGWYDEDIQKSMEILEKINPKVIEDPLLKELSLFLTGISSAMTPVGADFKIAIQMINNFTETGKLPSTNPVTGKQWNRNTNLKRQIDFAQQLIDQKGLEGFMSFLFDPISRREINTLRKDLANLGPIDPKLDIKSGETIGIDNKKMYGTDAFGPKLGPFLANLHGQSDNNVIDIWNVRGMNRRFGNMFIRDKDGNILTNKEGNIMVADQPRSQKERAQFIKFMNEVASLSNLSVRDAQAILWYYEQGLYTKLGVPSEPKKYSEVAEKFFQEQSNVSQGSLSSSDVIKNKIDVPKKKQGGSISIPQRRSLVNDGLVDINTIIGKINYGN